jgi:hypothetical protein
MRTVNCELIIKSKTDLNFRRIDGQAALSEIIIGPAMERVREMRFKTGIDELIAPTINLDL